MEQTYLPRLSKWAASLNARRLAGITLADVLAGDTCSPINLADFEAYLAFQEHSLENLQFIVWYNHYCARFFALPPNVRAHAAGPSDAAFAAARSGPRTAPTVVETDRRADAADAAIRARRDAAGLNSLSTEDRAEEDQAVENARRRLRGAVVLSGFYGLRGAPVPPDVRNCGGDGEAAAASLLPIAAATRVPTVTSLATLTDDADALEPLRTECMQVIETFFRPGAKKELALDQVVRDTAARRITCSCHPDVFLPAYDSVYLAVESGSLAQFLILSGTNVNSGKQYFWYFIGTSDLLIGLLIALVFIFTIPDDPSRHWTKGRAWRLVAVPFWCLGAMQWYCAWRGYGPALRRRRALTQHRFCTQVAGRSTRQLRVWELQPHDEETSDYLAERVRAVPTTPTIPLRSVATGAAPEPGYPPAAADARTDEWVERNAATTAGRRVSGASTLSVASARQRALVAPFSPPTAGKQSMSDDGDATELDEGRTHGDMPLSPISPHSPTPLLGRSGWTRQSGSWRVASPAPPRPPWRPPPPVRAADMKRPARNGYRRPPVFGPERVVRDARVAAAHQAVVRAILFAGLYCTLAFCAIIFAAPGWKRHAFVHMA